MSYQVKNGREDENNESTEREDVAELLHEDWLEQSDRNGPYRLDSSRQLRPCTAPSLDLRHQYMADAGKLPQSLNHRSHYFSR